MSTMSLYVCAIFARWLAAWWGRIPWTCTWHSGLRPISSIALKPRWSSQSVGVITWHRRRCRFSRSILTSLTPSLQTPVYNHLWLPLHRYRCPKAEDKSLEGKGEECRYSCCNRFRFLVSFPLFFLFQWACYPRCTSIIFNRFVYHSICIWYWYWRSLLVRCRKSITDCPHTLQVLLITVHLAHAMCMYMPHDCYCEEP